MPTNPFDTRAARMPASREMVRQSHAFAALGAAVLVLALLINNLIAAISHPDLIANLIDYLPSLLPGWLFAALLNALGCLLLSRGFMSSHGIVFANPARLLLGIAGAILLADLLYGAASGFLLSGVYEWLSENNDMLAVYQPLVFEPLGLVAFAITVLLPLWIGLKVGKRHSAPDKNPPPRVEVPLLLALAFILLNLKMLDLIPGHLLNDFEWHLELVLLYLSPLLCGTVIFTAAWCELPAHQSQLRTGQLILTSLLIFICWLAAQLMVGGLLLAAALAGNEIHPALLVAMGIGLLALLWPLTLLGLRWIYRAEAA